MWNFKIEVELVGAASEEYAALDVAMEACGFKTVDGDGHALPTGEYRDSCFVEQLSKEMVEKQAHDMLTHIEPRYIRSGEML